MKKTLFALLSLGIVSCAPSTNNIQTPHSSNALQTIAISSEAIWNDPINSKYNDLTGPTIELVQKMPPRERFTYNCTGSNTEMYTAIQALPDQISMWISASPTCQGTWIPVELKKILLNRKTMVLGLHGFAYPNEDYAFLAQIPSHILFIQSPDWLQFPSSSENASTLLHAPNKKLYVINGYTNTENRLATQKEAMLCEKILQSPIVKDFHYGQQAPSKEQIDIYRQYDKCYMNIPTIQK